MSRGFDWEAEGVRLGGTLDHVHAIAVLGTDAEATARVALGISRAQAARRRVAVCDLLGEAPPLQALVAGDDPHGIVDSFIYGISLNRVAREVPGIPGMFVMPTGSEPVDAAEIFPNARWRRLASGFREMGALLVLAARADAPAVEELTAQLDGAVLVGEALPTNLPVAAVISTVRIPAPPPVPPPSAGPSVVLVPQRRARISAKTLLRGGAAVALFTAIGLWFAWRPFSDTGRRPWWPPSLDKAPPPSAVVPAIVGPARADSVGPAADSLTDSTGAFPAVTNAADSAAAAAYAVELLATNTQAGAAARVRDERDRLPAGTFTPAVIDGAQWYKVVAGAYPERAAADSLLAELRRRGLLDARSGTVVRLPFAFLLHARVPADSVRPLLTAYADLGQAAYALRQPDGSIRVYAGAFETAEQAAMLTQSLRAAGITPTLVYRTGRVF